MPKYPRKGFQYFMSKKDFHPNNDKNLELVFRARQKVEIEKKREEERMREYEKEEEERSNRHLLTKTEKKYRDLSFMYEPPAGLIVQMNKDPNQKDEGKEIKYEWQRKLLASHSAPREEWAKNDETIRDQPFGMHVTDYKCYKCGMHGHFGIDRECPLNNSENPSDIIKSFKKSEIDIKPSASRIDEDKNLTDADFWHEEMKTEHKIKLKNCAISRVKQECEIDKVASNVLLQSLSCTSTSNDQKGKMVQRFVKSLSSREKKEFIKKCERGFCKKADPDTPPAEKQGPLSPGLLFDDPFALPGLLEPKPEPEDPLGFLPNMDGMEQKILPNLLLKKDREWRNPSPPPEDDGGTGDKDDPMPSQGSGDDNEPEPLNLKQEPESELKEEPVSDLSYLKEQVSKRRKTEMALWDLERTLRKEAKKQRRKH